MCSAGTQKAVKTTTNLRWYRMVLLLVEEKEEEESDSIINEKIA